MSVSSRDEIRQGYGEVNFNHYLSELVKEGMLESEALIIMQKCLTTDRSMGVNGTVGTVLAMLRKENQDTAGKKLETFRVPDKKTAPKAGELNREQRRKMGLR